MQVSTLKCCRYLKVTDGRNNEKGNAALPGRSNAVHYRRQVEDTYTEGFDRRNQAFRGIKKIYRLNKSEGSYTTAAGYGGRRAC